MKHYVRLGIDITAGIGTDVRVKVSAADDISGYLNDKITVTSTKLTKTIVNPTSNETLDLDVNEAAVDHDALLNYEVDEHRPLDDAQTTTTNLWSADKIQTDLDGKVNQVTPIADNKIIKSVGMTGVDFEETGINVDDSDNVTGINDLTISGDLTVNGTTTTVNSDTLEVTDANITVNNGGTQASADLGTAGLTIEMSDATDGIIGYDSSTTSKFKLGELGDAREILTASHTQSMTNKTINVDNNTLSEVETDNFKTGVIQTDISGSVSDTNLASSEAITEYVQDVVAVNNSLRIEAGQPELVGVRYQSYANAVAYIGTQGGASFFDRWSCNFYGQVTEDITLSPFIYVSSINKSGVIVGDITAGTNTSSEAFRVNDITFDSIFAPTVSTLVEVKNCTIISQDNAVSQLGTLFLRNTILTADTAPVTLDFDNIEATEGTQLTGVGNFNRISLRTAAYCTFSGSPTGGILNLYDGAASVYLTDGETLTISQLYSYTGNFYGSGFGFGTNPIVLINNTASYPSEFLNSTTYGVDFQISGVGGILKVYDSLKGTNAGNETFTEVSSGVLDVRGDIFIPTGTNLSSEDTVSAIIELDSDLSSHTGASSDVHGVGVGNDVVGTGTAQTLTNKTIDVDNNTVSNIETDNFKTGVVQTDITGVVSDTNIPTSEAVTEYVSSGFVPSSNGDIAETESPLTDGATGQPVSGFDFSPTDGAFEAIVYVEVDATIDLYERYTIKGLYNSTAVNWSISVSSSGDDVNLDFDITVAGQVTYNGPTFAGFNNGKIRYRVLAIGN